MGQTQGVAKRTAGSFLAVLWFIGLFLTALCVATVTLSASQLQSRLLALSQSGTPLSVWQIERMRKQWTLEAARIEEQGKRVADLRLANLGAETDAEARRVAYQSVRGDYEDARNDIVAKLKLYEPLFVDDDFARLDDQALRTKVDATIEQVGPLLLTDTRAAVATLHEVYIAAMRAMNDALQDGQVAGLAAHNAAQSLAREEAVLVKAESAIKAVIDPSGTRSQADTLMIHDLISEFAFIETFAKGSLHEFAILPSEFLVIILVIAMGVLGSTLQLTYDHARDKVRRNSHFFLRPMLGAITALVVFILLKAGVLVVTDSARLGEVAPLNPFFVAFVGIVSGVLSDNALETIRRVGESWFKTADTDRSDRWATGIKDLLTGDRSLDNLAARSGMDEADLKRWVDEAAPVPDHAQKILAAWLDRDVRTLFTDIPPPQTA